MGFRLRALRLIGRHPPPLFPRFAAQVTPTRIIFRINPGFFGSVRKAFLPLKSTLRFSRYENWGIAPAKLSWPSILLDKCISVVINLRNTVHYRRADPTWEEPDGYSSLLSRWCKYFRVFLHVYSQYIRHKVTPSAVNKLIKVSLFLSFSTVYMSSNETPPLGSPTLSTLNLLPFLWMISQIRKNDLNESIPNNLRKSIPQRIPKEVSPS